MITGISFALVGLLQICNLFIQVSVFIYMVDFHIGKERFF